MKSNKEDPKKQEFIGKRIRIISSSNSSLVGLQGEVVDETKHTLLVETSAGMKTVLKSHVVFEIQGVVMDGRHIVGRGEQRVRKK